MAAPFGIQNPAPFLAAPNRMFEPWLAALLPRTPGHNGTFVHLSGGQTIVVDAMPSKIVGQISEIGISVSVPARMK